MGEIKPAVLKKPTVEKRTEVVKIELGLNIKLVTIVLTIFAILFSVISIIAKTEFTGHKFIVYLFDVDQEKNFPTYFEVLLLLLSSVLFYIAAQTRSKVKGSYYFNWIFLSIIFFLMSADEFISLHEQTTQFFKGTRLGDSIHFGWLIPAAIFLVLFIISYIKFFLNLSSRFKLLFFVSAALYVFGVMGMELIGGIYQNSYGQNNLGYFVLTNFEETMEMLGLIFLIYSLLHYIKEVNSIRKILNQ